MRDLILGRINLVICLVSLKRPWIGTLGWTWELRRLPVAAAIAVSTMLDMLFTSDRRSGTISKAFGCPVVNGCGGHDAGFTAQEFPVGGMHVTAEDIIIEIIHEGGKLQPGGVAGEIVVPHLTTSDFPLIRYRTGNVGIFGSEKYTFGRGLPNLD